LSKTRTLGENVENNDSISILEIVRETPGTVARNKEFNSRLALYNKGCAATSSISLTEVVGAGWIAYSSTIDGTSGGTSDIPNREIRFSAGDLGTLGAKEYKILAYKILSPNQNQARGTLRYNLSWGDKNIYENEDYMMNTSSYTTESHLLFEILAIGSFKDRSAEPSEDQFYEFNVTNTGDYNISNSTWNVTVRIPGDCNVSNHTGTFNVVSRDLLWNLGNLTIDYTNTFFFNMNCSDEGDHVLLARGINDTRTNTTTTEVASSEMGCSGIACSDTTSYNFSKPANARYEKMIQADFLVEYNFTDYALTIGEGYLNFTDDLGKGYSLWQNNTFIDSSGSYWINYSIESSEWDDFDDESRNVGVYSYADGTSDTPFGNVTIPRVSYTWTSGALFEEGEDLFVNIKPYVFTLSAPVLSLPGNASSAYVNPVVLSWATPSIPEGYNLTYYVYGDTTDGSTYLGSVNVAQYFWWGLATGNTYYWKVKAGIEGQNSSFSETWQFDLDLCQPDTDYAYALNYPMSYNATTDTITVWGSNGTGSTAMGFNSTNPITFAQIYAFGRAKRGVCAVTNPATGSYSVLTNLHVGNTSSLINTTFLKTTGESISFSKQVKLNFNSTFTIGQLSEESNPIGASTLSFSGVNNINSGEGLLYTLNGSTLEIYDSLLTHATSVNLSELNPWSLYWNGRVTAKRSSFEKWWTIRFANPVNNLEDIVLTNVGEGFYPTTTQTGTITTVKPRTITEQGIYFYNDTDITVISLEISETTGDDMRVLNYTGTANLINPTLNWSSINWSTGTYPGQINRKYDYDATTTDSSGVAIANTTMVMLDVFGNVLFSLTTDSGGNIDAQTITRAIYNYNNKNGVEQGTHTLYIKKYGKAFQTVSKEFAAATVETVQLSTNIFVSGSEATAAALNNIKYNKPAKVSYGAESNASVTTSMTLAHSPVDQCQYYAIFANGTKLVEGVGVAGDYALNYETGVITFNQSMVGYNITPTYYYGGNLSITNGITIANAFVMGDLYKYMQYASATINLSEELKTVDGIKYSFCIDLAVGNDTAGGSIQDIGKTIEFEAGYDVVVGEGGAIIDLAGVGGSGLVESIEVGKPEIKIGETQKIYVSLSNNLGQPETGHTILADIYYPNGSIWLEDQLFTEYISGFYKLEFLIPSDHTVYGVHAAHISGSFTAIRTFNIVPEQEITVHSELNDPVDMLNWHIGSNKENISIILKIKNRLEEMRNLSQFYLWDNSYFVTLPTYLISNPSKVEVYDLGSEEYPETLSDENLTGWIYSGDVTNISRTDFYKLNPYSMNATLNFSTGSATFYKNFSSPLNFSTNSSQIKDLHVVMYFPDTNFTNLSIKLKTNETNYYLKNKPLIEWYVQYSGWSYPSIEFTRENLTSVGSPDLENITGIEITIIGTDNHTTPTNIYLDHIGKHNWNKIPRERISSRVISTEGEGTVFWWDSNDKYNLNPLELRENLVIFESEELEDVRDWAQAAPNDATLQSLYQNMLSANFYWEYLRAYHTVKDYLQGNPGQNLFLISDIGGSYSRSDEPRISILTADRIGNLISANVSVNITYPNGTILSSGIPTQSQTGNYNYSFSIPSTAPYGDYSVLINANYSGYNATNTHVFTVATASSGGESGGLPLNIFSGVGSTYAPGDTVYIVSTAINSTGELVNATVNVNLYYANGSLLSSGRATQTSEGRTKYNYTLSGSQSQETYSVEIDANYSGNEVHESLVFIVDVPASGAANPEVVVEAPDNINTNTAISITALTLSGAGVVTDCIGNANITIKDLISGTEVLSTSIMTNFGTGKYNYTWITENQSVFLASVICTMSGIDYTGVTSFSTQDISTQDEFRISSLVVGSPKYRDETAIIEATFEDESGANVTPDTIDLTIWYPSYLSIWDSAVKSDFALKNGTVWWYAKSIESNPTTGDYRVHMQATYNNVTSTRTTEFRIATGGPYMVVLECPDSSNVGANLACSVKIQDEGEAATESTCSVWVDTGGDNLMDGTEPQTSFSKETVPLQNVTQAVAINVPSSHATGTYITRVSCSYANSAQPDSTASDSVTFTSAVVPPVVSSGGGGGGSSGGGSGMITGETIKYPKHLMDIFTRILDEYKIISPGGKVLMEVTLFNLGTEEIKDLRVRYCIESGNRSLIKCEEETVAVYTKVQLVKEFLISTSIGGGEYFIKTTANYENETIFSETSFEIIVQKKEPSSYTEIDRKLVYWILILIAIIMSIIIISWIRRRFVYKRPEEKRQGRIKRYLSKLKKRKRDKKLIRIIKRPHYKRGQEREDLNKLVHYMKGE
jgi:hypothetical protein